ncbi:unnamed protein product [Alternaria alternata]
MIFNVTGITSFSFPKSQYRSTGGVIIIGTIGESSIIDPMISGGKLDRGFYINDNAPALSGWITAKFPGAGEPPIYGAEFHALVFELVLRLRGNYLWPAGGNWTQMFFVDDKRNQRLADEYAVVIGTSHTEPFQRATK